LLVPAPSVGVLSAMILQPGHPLSRVVFVLSKIWLFALPVVWLLVVERGRPSFSPLRRGGMLAGLLSGVVLSAGILAAYGLLGERMIPRDAFVAKLTAVGLADWRAYLAGALYWVLVNSVLEEYVWRWFCTEQFGRLMRPRAAIVASALCFTLHHALALHSYFPEAPIVTAACSAGVFVGGVTWSALYVRTRSVWPGYFSHAIVDIAVFGLGAAMLFG
jgi:membrane protease YdiL (CAAX protease family)